MKHIRSDYDAIQPWPTKRPHHGMVTEEGPDGELHKVKYLNLTDDSLEQLAGSVEPIIPEDEPVFLIRGQDLAAIPAAVAWCRAASELGADPSLIEAVQRHILLVKEWQDTHVAKVPDAPADVL